MPDVGDATTPQLIVYPFDGTTAATLTVYAPPVGDDPPVTTAPAVDTPTEVSTVVDGAVVTAQQWTTEAVVLDTPGWWLLTWTVAGTGYGVQHERVYVSAAPSGPAWAPDLVAVAKYVPRRTVVAAANGYGTPQDTFTTDTHPSASQVEALIGDAVAWVQTAVAEPAEALHGAARRAASLWTAAMVELTWPDNRDDLTTADRLLAEAKAARADLDVANTAATGTDPETPGADLLPLWSFPPANLAWDLPIG